MPDNRNSSPTPSPLVLLLCILAPPLGLLAWVLASGSHRPAYLGSGWVRTGLTLLLLGSAPLVAIILAAEIGLWPDPNPNPVGPGLLFFFAVVLATCCLAVGVVTVWLKLRRAS